MEADEKSSQLLRELAYALKRIIDDGLSRVTLVFEDEEYFRWIVEDFKYDDTGVSESGARENQFVKKSWFRASRKIVEEIEKSEIYKTSLEHLKAIFGEKVNEHTLSRFINKVISDYLNSRKFDEEWVRNLIQILLKGLREEPLSYGAEVLLEGIVLRPDKVEISHGVVLRKTLKEDLEKEHPFHRVSFSPRSYFPRPSAILHVEFQGTRAYEIQRRVEQAITLLRLFKPGSVTFISYRMYSESLTDMMAGGTLSSGGTALVLDKCLITDEDVRRLKKFWENLQPILPQSLYWPGGGKEDHTTIAYRRYNDALLQDGLIERRITNAIMGLEALLLKPGEVQELVYRLKNRLAKVLSFFKYDPLQVSKVVSDAYQVRNLFAHGGQLSYKERKHLEDKYKEVKNLLMHVVDYLRVCIITYITLNLEKDAFIDLIDASFIERKSDEQLPGVLNTARYVLGV